MGVPEEKREKDVINSKLSLVQDYILYDKSHTTDAADGMFEVIEDIKDKLDILFK